MFVFLTDLYSLIVLKTAGAARYILSAIKLNRTLPHVLDIKGVYKSLNRLYTLNPHQRINKKKVLLRNTSSAEHWDGEEL